MPQTIRLEFAKSNTKVSKPKQPAAAAATSHPALMHPLTGRKYAPPLVHLLDTSHLLFLTHCTDYKVSHFLLSLGCFFSKGFFFTYVPSLAPSPARDLRSRHRESYNNWSKYEGVSWFLNLLRLISFCNVRCVSRYTDNIHVIIMALMLCKLSRSIGDKNICVKYR